jgi:hypothetical protein
MPLGPLASIPTGRLLYARADEAPFILVRHDRSGAFFLTEDGWDERSRAAGPFDPNDVLRALRLANVRVPDGCERGPWSWGVDLFPRAVLPHPPPEYSRFDPSWAPPSASAYSSEDVDGVVNERCCAPPRDEPRVRWILTSALPTGLLDREWNAHPRGSLVLAQARSQDAFVVIDLPPAPSSR